MNSLARLVCTIVLLVALTVISSAPVGAGPLPITCDLDGIGAYVFDPQTNIDDYEWSGEIDRCRSTFGAMSPEKGSFTGTGFVDTDEASGRGTMTIRWDNGQRSVLEGVHQEEFTMTGIPEVLGMTGDVNSGLYAGETMTMEMHCKPKDTRACFETGASTWSFLGSVEFGP